MAFPRLSYFEFFDGTREIYVSLFKTHKTTIKLHSIPELGSPVFPEILKVDDETFERLFFILKKNNFGFHDTFFFLPKQKQYVLSDIKTWMASLYYFGTNEITPYYAAMEIQSLTEADFTMTVYVKSFSLPQEAIDVIPIFQSESNEPHVALGYKKKSEEVEIVVKNKNYTSNLLQVGVFGHVIFGEHLEPEEKKTIENYRKAFRGLPLQMEFDKSIAPVLRTLYEEGGYEFKNEKFHCYYVYYDDKEGRDARYWVDDVYGYPRESGSDTILVLINGTAPMKVPNPIDVLECEKGVILKAVDAVAFLEVFKQAAFPSHIRQLSKALVAFHQILLAYKINFPLRKV